MAFPEARHSGRPYRLEWEEELLDMQRVADYLANGRWYRRVSSQGQVAVGGHLYHLGKAYARQEVEIAFSDLGTGLSAERGSSSRASAHSGGNESGPDGRGSTSGIGTVSAFVSPDRFRLARVRPGRGLERYDFLRLGPGTILKDSTGSLVLTGFART